MEALRKQVMPFLLRRTKDEVLSDLPEKIIQDRYCDLSPVQLKLYEQFSGSHVRREISSMVKVNEDKGEGPKASSHVFQALQYLLKLCSHPLLVIGESIPESLLPHLTELFPASSCIASELHKLHHSPKLVALQEILEECGIVVEASGAEGPISVGQHLVLIFAQHKALLDIIERDLFHTHMKRLDMTKFYVFGAGIFTGLIVALYPISVVKTRMQVASHDAIERNAFSIIKGLQTWLLSR